MRTLRYYFIASVFVLTATSAQATSPQFVAHPISKDAEQTLSKASLNFEFEEISATLNILSPEKAPCHDACHIGRCHHCGSPLIAKQKLNLLFNCQSQYNGNADLPLVASPDIEGPRRPPRQS